MIRKTERYFTKRINKKNSLVHDAQYIKRTSYWFLFIIPIFTKDEIIKGDYERLD